MTVIKHLVRFGPTQFRPIDTGIYKVRLLSIKEDEGKFNQERFVFKYEIVDGEFAGAFCNDFVNFSNRGVYGVGNKLGKVVKALIGECEIDQDLDIYSLVGKTCQVCISRSGMKNKIYRWEATNG